jgi:hypothetical protein
MKISVLNENAEIHIINETLHLMIRNQSILSNFSGFGKLINGLLPIVYYKDKLFYYFDLETNQLFKVNGVDWISGLHYVGDCLTYMGHNYRTDPILSRNEQYKFTTKEILKPFIESIPDSTIDVQLEYKFCYDQQKMVHTGLKQLSGAISKTKATSMFQSLKYYRIVGKGTLNKGINLINKPFNSNHRINFHPSLYSLSKTDECYGVVDVRNNEFIVDLKYKCIDIWPQYIFADQDIFTFKPLT